MKGKSLVFQTLVIITLLLGSMQHVSAQDGNLAPSSLAITGTIVDNYANISYSLVFDNSESETDTLTSYSFKTPESLLLGNLSASMGNRTYWAHVDRLSDAVNTFNDSITSNQSAVLVRMLEDSYYLEVNIEAGEILELTAYFEGILTRKNGEYNLELLDVTSMSYTSSLLIDIDITSTLSTILAARLAGISGEDRIDITNGKNLYYFDETYSYQENIILSYSLETLEAGGKVLTYGNGTDNFFVYIYAPEIRNVEQREPREFIFVIDISGSMTGTKISQAKEAFVDMIETLSDDDIFNVVAFSDAISSLWLSPKAGTQTNINSAIDWVYDLQSGGSTNLDGAILSALRDFDPETRTAKVVAFLSDGHATVGELKPEKIRSNAVEENEGEAMLFTVGFGDAADDALMAALAYDSGGEFVPIDEDTNAISALSEYYQTFSTPLAVAYSIDYSNVIEVNPASETLKGALFNGSEVLQSGRFTAGLSISTSIEYANGQSESWSNGVATAGTDMSYVERIWAHHKIDQILELITINGETHELVKQIEDLALYYGIVVPGYTALILVIEDNDETDDTDGETDQSNDQTDMASDTQTDPPSYDAVAPHPPISSVDAMLHHSFILPVILIVPILRKWKKQ